mgnify:CR=1 FL=1
MRRRIHCCKKHKTLAKFAISASALLKTAGRECERHRGFQHRRRSHVPSGVERRCSACGTLRRRRTTAKLPRASTRWRVRRSTFWQKPTHCCEGARAARGWSWAGQRRRQRSLEVKKDKVSGEPLPAERSMSIESRSPSQELVEDLSRSADADSPQGLTTCVYSIRHAASHRLLRPRTPPKYSCSS